MSDFSALSVSLRALRASQLAIQTAGNNIANANTDGYSRQTVIQAESYPQPVATAGPVPVMYLGTGVEVQKIQRQRDQLLDDRYRAQSAYLGQLDRRSSILSQVEKMAGEPGETGLQAALDRFFASLQELSSHPESATARQGVTAQTQSLTSSFADRDRQLTDLQTQLDHELVQQVDVLNGLGQQIVGLNRQIREAPQGAETANSLLDERDRLLDQVARLTGSRTLAQPDGTVTVMLGTYSFVNGDSLHQVIATPGPAGFALVAPAISPGTFLELGGEMGERISLRANDLTGQRSGLDALAAALAQQINTLHQGGFGRDGSTNRNFFSGSTAATLALDPALAADPSRIAAAKTAAGTPGDGSNALAMAQVNQMLLMAGATETIHDAYQSQVGSLAIRSQSATQDAQRQDAVLQFLSQKREESSGVSLDEEVANLLRYQHAYEAAARLITTVDQMLDRLINNTGLVGR